MITTKVSAILPQYKQAGWFSALQKLYVWVPATWEKFGALNQSLYRFYTNYDIFPSYAYVETRTTTSITIIGL